MSKLVDKLKQASEGGAPPMGFKSAMLPRQAPLLLVLEFHPPPALVCEVGESLDAAMASVDNLSKELEGMRKLRAFIPEQLPLGIAVKSLSEKTISQLKEIEADFVTFDSGEATTAFLMTDGPGKIVRADSSWTDTDLRALGTLPVDAILAEEVADETALTLESLIKLRRYPLLTGKPLLVRLSFIPSENDLSALLQVQARGLLITVSSETDLAEAARLRRSIQKLPLPRARKASAGVLLPQLSRAETAAEEGEEEEEDRV
ncbi:MAG: hypothetical protein HYY29_04085 [Chloroflexi bacterium]|nr:hypothetical protein [Chloroflexota bacterium]